MPATYRRPLVEELALLSQIYREMAGFYHHETPLANQTPVSTYEQGVSSALNLVAARLEKLAATHQEKPHD